MLELSPQPAADEMDPSIYRQLGEHSARLRSLEEGSAAANAKLDVLLQRSAVSQGARRMLWKVGAASGGAGGLLAALASWWVDMFGGRGGTP